MIVTLVCMGEGRRTLLSAGLLGLGTETEPRQTVDGLELLHRLRGIVDEGEAGALATTIVSPEAEDRDRILIGLVERRKLVAELILGHVGAVGMEDVPRESSLGCGLNIEERRLHATYTTICFLP
jgi:hypothetical protein